jgi:PiT family inorganic phosphate transporter
VRRWHRVGFGLQCLAYGANDGQKMLAVLAVATGVAAGGTVPATPWQLAALAGAFLVGTVLGLPRIAGTLGGGLVPIHPPAAVVTELAGAAVVLGTGAAGSPVSMTQAASGALVGTATTGGTRRVRWRQALRLVGAWAITLPAAILLSVAVAAVVRMIS